MALTEYQVAETQLYLAESTRGYPEVNDDGDKVSTGSVCPKSGDMWRFGCRKSLDWDSDMEMNSVEEEEDRESVMDHDVMESPLWASVRAFLHRMMSSASVRRQ